MCNFRSQSFLASSPRVNFVLANNPFFLFFFKLIKKGVALLAKTRYEPVTLPGVEKPVTPLSPEGHYLFLPSDNNSLLLKSIAVSELMLPNDFQSSVEGPSDSALSAVATCLDQVKFFFHIYKKNIIMSI